MPLKINHMTPKPSLICSHLFMWLSLVLIALPAIALDLDRNKPIKVEANKADIDDKRGVSTYTGNVIVNQGSLRITSDTLTLYTKNQSLEKMIATGNPATYTQRQEGQKEDIHAQGQKMEYYINSDTVIFIDNAIMRQYGNTFKSNRITYDIANDKVNAGTKAGGQRVTITIQPKTEKTGEPLPQSGPVEQGNPPAQAPQPSLQKKPLP